MSKKEDKLLKYNEEYDGKRFRSKIENYEAWGKDSNVCCKWKGHCEKFGHGRFSLSRKGKANGKSIPVLAHRLSYYLFHNKTLPKNLVCHKPLICHDPSCVNPLHLVDGTYSDNNGKHRKLDGTSPDGIPRSEETKNKIRNAQKGIPRFYLCKSYKIKFTDENKPDIVVDYLKGWCEKNKVNYKTAGKCASSGRPYKRHGILKIEKIN